MHPKDLPINLPAGIWCENDVVSTSMRRDYVASTLIRRHFDTKCPLGSFGNILRTVKILKFGTPQTIAIVVLKVEKFDVTLH